MTGDSLPVVRHQPDGHRAKVTPGEVAKLPDQVNRVKLLRKPPPHQLRPGQPTFHPKTRKVGMTNQGHDDLVVVEKRLEQIAQISASNMSATSGFVQPQPN